MVAAVRNIGRDVIWLLGVNVVLRVVWLSFVHPPQLYDFAWYYSHAVQMYQGGGYQWGGHPTAYWPIGYPWFLSMLFHVTGPSVLAGLIANVVLSTGISCLVYGLAYLSLRNTSARIPLAAALGYTCLPSHIEWNAVLGSEELFTFLLLLSLLLFVCWSRWAHRYELLIFAGFVMGIACDVRPIGLAFPVVVFLYSGFVLRRGWWKAFIDTLCYGCSFVLGLLPVTLRNWVVMHHFILVSTNGGVDLWQGTKADGSYYWSWNPYINPLAPYHGKNEVLENQIGTQVALTYILHHPVRTVLHGLAKWFFLYWQDSNVVSVTFGQLTPTWSRTALLVAEWVNNIAYYIWMVFAVAGVWFASVQRSWIRREWWIPIGFVFYNTAFFFFFPAWDRFRFPIMPCLALGFGIAWWHWRNSRRGV